MSSEAITRNDLKAVLDEVIPSDIEGTAFEADSFAFSSGFAPYSTDQPRAYKVGRVVMLSGAFTTTSAQSSTGQKVIGRVPLGCEPQIQCRAIVQGSGMNRMCLYIGGNGDIVVDRYATTTDTPIPSGAWLNIGCTYISATPT